MTIKVLPTAHLVGLAKPHMPVLNKIWDWQPAPVEQSTSKNTLLLLVPHALQLEAVWVGPNLLRLHTLLLQCPQACHEGHTPVADGTLSIESNDILSKQKKTL